MSGETQPLAGTIEISVSDYNLINTGTISASCAYGKGGKGGTIGLYVEGSISNSGLIVTGTFGDFDGMFGAPMAGNIVLMTSYSFENTGIIDASSWLGDNGKGGTIDVISTENITNQGQISADTYGLETGSDHPDGDGTVVLDYGQMGD
ncbi:MAG TPA: hypothetical protein PLV45_14005 [bacterium]|nr:hypothetical protein [bacterium]